MENLPLLQFHSHRVFAAAAAIAVTLSATAYAAEPRPDAAKEMIQTMGNAMIGQLSRGVDQAAREQQLRSLYRANFDTAGIAAGVIGLALQGATPQQRQQLLNAFEDYVVAAYSSKFASLPARSC